MTRGRDYRTFEIRALEESGIVEGYAAVFEQPAVMYERDGIEYKEVISRGAFDGAQMDNVVMNYNHQGKPVARVKNGTLRLAIDSVGLKIQADLSGTDEGRKLYDEIKGGYIDQMSFAFTSKDDGEEYDKATHTRRLTAFKRIYDVAAVDIPAYDTTSIHARSFFEAEAERELAEAIALNERKQELKIKLLKIKLMIGVSE